MDPNELTDDEWYTILEGTGAASGLIMMADMSGAIGVSKETMAAMDVLREDTWKSPFMAALRTRMFGATKAQQEEMQRRAQQTQQDLKNKNLTPGGARHMLLYSISSAVSLVESKFGAETAAEYRQMLYRMGEKTAEAGKEGTFLGLGGKQVSDLEKAALADLKTTLNL
jgi:hypothetical protein